MSAVIIGPIERKCNACPRYFKTKNPRRDLCERCIIQFIENIDIINGKKIRGAFAKILKGAIK